MFSSSPPPPTTPAGETSRIKSFMGRTPAIGILKSKFLTVLGNSNELLNGISSKLTLNISSSDSDYCDDDEEIPTYDESIDYTKIDYESRRVKARRAHEEIISGRYRQPNLAPRPRLDALHNRKANKSRSSSSSSSSSSSTSTSSRSFNVHAQDRSHVSSTTRSNSIESRHSGGYERKRAIAGARRSEMDVQRDLMRLNDVMKPSNAIAVSAVVIGGAAGAAGGGGMGGVVAVDGIMPPTIAPHIEVQPPHDRDPSKSSMANMVGTTSNHSMRVPAVRRKNSNSSTLTSLRDDLEYQVSPSVESTDWRHFIRSESQNSVPSWASSISLDCRAGEEPIKEFMKRFVDALFNNANSVDLGLKSEFGAMVRLEIGRQWFVRFLLQQKNKTKRLDEVTFHSLVQYFAIVLFECGECADYAPAAMVMNLSFTFYREIEVPGCDPYREYLCTFIRDQPIWLSLKFWNAAFMECMEVERNHRLLAKQKKQERRKTKEKAKNEVAEHKTLNADILDNEEKALNKHDISDSSSSHHSHGNRVKKERPAKATIDPALELDKEMENIAFRQLAHFTCNIHALGAPQDLCLEFFKKQQANLGLPKEKSKLVRDNVHRIYYETEIWGSKQS